MYDITVDFTALTIITLLVVLILKVNSVTRNIINHAYIDRVVRDITLWCLKTYGPDNVDRDTVYYEVMVILDNEYSEYKQYISDTISKTLEELG